MSGESRVRARDDREHERSAAALTSICVQAMAEVDGRSPADLADFLGYYLDVACREPFSRVVLQEGPAVLGQEPWQEVVDDTIGHGFRAVVASLVDEGARLVAPVELVVPAMIGGLHELALAVASSPDPELARRQSSSLVRELARSMTTAMEDGAG